MAKKQITLEGIIYTIRKKISKSIDNKLAKKIDSILDNPSRATLRKAAEFAKGLAEVNIVKVDSPSAKYYQAWLRNAKSKQYKNQGINLNSTGTTSVLTSPSNATILIKQMKKY